MIDFCNQDTCRASSGSALQLQLLPSDRAADWSGHREMRTGTRKTICYRCLQWEREAGCPHRLWTSTCPSARGRVQIGSTSRGFRSRLFKASETTFALPILSQSALRAGRVPALLPFSSRLFRRTHHTTKQSRNTGHQDEDNEELVGYPAASNSDHSGFSETERDSLAVASCAALSTANLADRPTSALGPLEKDTSIYSPRLSHGDTETDAVGSLGNSALCALRHSVEGSAPEPWHLVGGQAPTYMSRSMVEAHRVESACVMTTSVSEGSALAWAAEQGPPAGYNGRLSDGAAFQHFEQQCAAEAAAACAAAEGESSSQVSAQEHIGDVDDGQSPFSVAERSVQALAGAGELVAGLFAATVTLGRPASGGSAVESISVDMPDSGDCVQVTSSEENSPQLVDVLRQSALHDRYRNADCGARRFSLEPAAAHDCDMMDALHDSVDLDDSWVTVEGYSSEGQASPSDIDQNRSSLEAARGFLRRHLLERLRPPTPSR